MTTTVRKARRAIVKTIPVMPGLNVVIENTNNVLIQLTTEDGSNVEVARSNAITNIEALRIALDAAREWVSMEEDSG